MSTNLFVYFVTANQNKQFWTVLPDLKKVKQIYVVLGFFDL